MDGSDETDRPAMSEREIEALHQTELGIENLHRAHGHLVSFHHSTGRAMDHLARAEELLRESGHPDLADTLRDDHLPRGVIPAASGSDPSAGRWSYELLERYQDTFLDDLVAFGDRVTEQLAGGQRHVAERAQERRWKRRAEDGADATDGD